ncbi:hypothetical protein MGU_10745 [Metarhizium guizhouense ARSEF 977]|uniref:DUF2264 domain-containing protein n=1 Tax=Metarhizium guizhouense (strain ARSEF 977) TaxID=1276136 RepID=A0A0B4GWP4_METGA|nr:hypothetical protein MGU_10745 [Metarhizium guizhouense ARSEF 977]
MPSLAGFSDNPLDTKENVSAAARALLKPLIPHFSPGRARIRLPIISGAQFDEHAAGLEGYARPLWVVAALLSDGAGSEPLLEPWIIGLRNGIDPSHKDYWGPIGDWDQRMVEAEIISFALLAAPESFYETLDASDKNNLVRWLKGLNGKVMPENNWRWFRVLSNLALIKVCGVEHALLWPFVQQDLETLEGFYMSDGWASDGVWRATTEDPKQEGTGVDAGRGRHADYYSGSFAIQFSQLLYSKFASDLDPERCSVFRDRAKQFARTFWAYFDQDGASIPFGRSLCYKFAMGGFYAAFAYCGLCDDADEYTSYGAVKGMLLRHLRWWASKSENIFWSDGTLNIGYLYPNMYLSEDYNSPQSPYWALKSLIVVALPGGDAFWSAKELSHPLCRGQGLEHSGENEVMPVKPARQIVCNHGRGRHHFLLSSGQFCVWPMKATQAKYAKFAYSSAFGFSVPTGPLIAQIAPDNMLALSKDHGETWTVRWVSTGETKFVPVPVFISGSPQRITALVNRWKPWSTGLVEVETTLIPPCSSWPDWHVRVHRICSGNDPSLLSLDAVEGGFAIDGRQKANQRIIPKLQGNAGQTLMSLGLQDGEVALETPDSSLVISSAGASGIVNLCPLPQSSLQSVGEALKADPNTNLMTARTLLPTVKHSGPSWPEQDVVIITAVFAIHDEKNTMTLAEIEERWSRRPCVKYNAESGLSLN